MVAGVGRLFRANLNCKANAKGHLSLALIMRPVGVSLVICQ